MPYKEKNIEKLYYSISEVAKMFKVSNSLLRFWESEFKIIKPKKNKKGNRLYTKSDVEKIRTIYQLVKVEGFTLDGAKKRLSENRKGTRSQSEIKASLLEIKTFLNELNDLL